MTRLDRLAGPFFPKSERSRIMALVKGKNTTPELIVRRLVYALGFRQRVRSVKAAAGASKRRIQSSFC